jgi:transketolase
MNFQWPKEPISSETGRKALRQAILEQIAAANSGHPGGSLSLVEIVASIFDGYFHEGRPATQGVSLREAANFALDRDRMVLSKGHGVPALYSALSYLGYFEAAELAKLRSLGHFLQGHPDRNHFDFMEASTGSLGQGASVALGLALSTRLNFEQKKYSRLPRVYCVLGDGEMQEGQVWEMLMSAPKFDLGNLVCVLDYNKGQIDGPVKEIMDLEPLAAKLKAFNWDVHEVDGHDVGAIQKSLSLLRVEARSQPHFIVAHTVKGKGVSFMEHPTQWHGAAPSSEQLEAAIQEICAGPSPYGRILS